MNIDSFAWLWYPPQSLRLIQLNHIGTEGHRIHIDYRNSIFQILHARQDATLQVVGVAETHLVEHHTGHHAAFAATAMDDHFFVLQVLEFFHLHGLELTQWNQFATQVTFGVFIGSRQSMRLIFSPLSIFCFNSSTVIFFIIVEFDLRVLRNLHVQAQSVARQ